ncbi:uncharacterized protein LOC111318178 isoform X2 [Durio zibethinus]|uniref:Uncharacterized protein LOC111318178 isoform X2 n=1 Tax=Durio zibethinus TaxID=66656 RepID=A0A6P6BHM2_DURZI|nr:uncharacterized protein LOC111318178 isoform X2 [Durio zibethinus]
MHLWRKIRRVWLSVSGRLKPHKPTGGQGGASGLLKLQDDVKTCGYKDVQVMWNLLNTSQIKQIGAAAATTAVSQSRKCSKQRPSWMAFFWPNQRATPPSSSSSCWVKSSKTVY